MNSNVLGYTIMYHVEIRLSSKKVNFFSLSFLISVDCITGDLCNNEHRGNDKNEKSKKVKHEDLVCLVYTIMYHGMKWLSNEKVKFFSRERSKNVRYPCQPPVTRMLLSSEIASRTGCKVIPSRSQPRRVAELWQSMRTSTPSAHCTTA